VFGLCNVKFAETVNKKGYMLSFQHGAVHFLLYNLDFQITFDCFQIVKPLFRGLIENALLYCVQHIVNRLFRFVKLFLEAWQIYIFSALQFHYKVSNILDNGIIHNHFHCSVYNHILNPRLFNCFLFTPFMAFRVRAFIILIEFACAACSAFTYHERRTQSTMELC